MEGMPMYEQRRFNLRFGWRKQIASMMVLLATQVMAGDGARVGSDRSEVAAPVPEKLMEPVAGPTEPYEKLPNGYRRLARTNREPLAERVRQALEAAGKTTDIDAASG